MLFRGAVYAAVLRCSRSTFLDADHSWPFGHDDNEETAFLDVDIDSVFLDPLGHTGKTTDLGTLKRGRASPNVAEERTSSDRAAKSRIRGPNLASAAPVPSRSDEEPEVKPVSIPADRVIGADLDSSWLAVASQLYIDADDTGDDSESVLTTTTTTMAPRTRRGRVVSVQIRKPERDPVPTTSRKADVVRKPKQDSVPTTSSKAADVFLSEPQRTAAMSILINDPDISVPQFADELIRMFPMISRTNAISFVINTNKRTKVPLWAHEFLVAHRATISADLASLAQPLKELYVRNGMAPPSSPVRTIQIWNQFCLEPLFAAAFKRADPPCFIEASAGRASLMRLSPYQRRLYFTAPPPVEPIRRPQDTQPLSPLDKIAVLRVLSRTPNASGARFLADVEAARPGLDGSAVSTFRKGIVERAQVSLLLHQLLLDNHTKAPTELVAMASAGVSARKVAGRSNFRKAVVDWLRFCVSPLLANEDSSNPPCVPFQHGGRQYMRLSEDQRRLFFESLIPEFEVMAAEAMACLDRLRKRSAHASGAGMATGARAAVPGSAPVQHRHDDVVLESDE